MYNTNNDNVNPDCILNLTLDCFKSMSEQTNVQKGGGIESTPIQRLLPYLTAYNKHVQGTTLIPNGLIDPDVSAGTYWNLIPLSMYFTSPQLKKLKTELNNYKKRI
uniref:Uncharacterized protein n=1 Tax=viral metagenome TaxID=1070528 RepID=A0A6C0J495_9ZZZZ